jgi:hypothetical protein
VGQGLLLLLPKLWWKWQKEYNLCPTGKCVLMVFMLIISHLMGIFQVLVVLTGILKYDPYEPLAPIPFYKADNSFDPWGHAGRFLLISG